MSPGLLRRAQAWYQGVGLSCGTARVRYCAAPAEPYHACHHPHPRAVVTVGGKPLVLIAWYRP